MMDYARARPLRLQNVQRPTTRGEEDFKKARVSLPEDTVGERPPNRAGGQGLAGRPRGSISVFNLMISFNPFIVRLMTRPLKAAEHTSIRACVGPWIAMGSYHLSRTDGGARSLVEGNLITN